MRQMKQKYPTLRQGFFQKWGLAYIFLVPAITLFCIFLIYPLIRSVVLSFQEWEGLGDPEFIAFKNYRNLFKSTNFWVALKNTLLYTVGGVTTTVVIGLCLALAIERRVFGWKFYKFIFYISVMLSTSVVSIMFVNLLEPNFGLVNSLLRAVGLDTWAKSWLADPNTALPAIVVVSMWQYSGFCMLLFLAAMEGIDPAIHEAATLDGVTEKDRIFYITLPIIKRSIFVVIMLQIIFSLKSFDIMQIMTKGGPGNATETLTTYLFRTAMNHSKYGLASAISVVMIVLISIVTIFYMRKTQLGDQVVE